MQTSPTLPGFPSFSEKELESEIKFHLFRFCKGAGKGKIGLLECYR